MFRAARDAGVTSIACTPHCNDAHFDYMGMWHAFRAFEQEVLDIDPTFSLQMGFEVDFNKFVELGTDWAERLHFDGSNELLIALPQDVTGEDLVRIGRIVAELQEQGYDLILSHLEESSALQENPGLAQELVEKGCKLQVCASSVCSDHENVRQMAEYLLAEGLCSYIASDAHSPEDYDRFAFALEKWGDSLAAEDSSVGERGSGFDTYAAVFAPFMDDTGTWMREQIEDALNDGEEGKTQEHAHIESEKDDDGESSPDAPGELSGAPTEAAPNRYANANGRWSASGRNGRGVAPKRIVLVVAGSLVMLACVVSLAFAITKPVQQKEASQSAATKTEQVEKPTKKKAELKTAKVSVTIDVPDLDKEGSSVPLSVSGTQADGQGYKKDLFVESGKSTLELPEGTYTAKVAETPIASNGTMYWVPEDAVKIVVAKDGVATVEPKEARIELRYLSALDVPDALIESAKQWIIKDPERAKLADKLADAAKALRASAQREQAAAIEREEAERRFAEEEAARAAEEEAAAAADEEYAAEEQAYDESTQQQQQQQQEQQEQQTQEQQTQEQQQQQEQPIATESVAANEG